ncbi:MAG: zinc ABC transporter substrate-binding protein, partial [Niameybacter sp.]
MKKKTAILILLVIAYTGFILYKYNERTKLQQEIAHKPFTVVTSFYPMYIHTSALMKETPHQLLNMADQTVGCLHDYQLTVQDTKKLYEADVLVINGLGSETFIEKAYMQNPTLQV